MKLTQEARDVRTAGVGQVVQATIRATAKVFNFFSDMTYSNKAEAVVRELVANAIDAHKMGGIDAPVTVTLPTEDDPVLRVKDQGVGMSHEFMTGQYMAYTDGTTKTDSNIAIGGLGIGSKSPFAYTDQYLIRSVHDGQVGTYSIFKDAEGIPSILPLELAETDEPNGVEVMVAIDPDDFAKFREVAETILAYFEPRPVLVNGEIKEPDYIAKGDGWAVRRTAGDLAIIMGGVRYKVPSTDLPYDMRQEPLTSYGVDLTLPIGACSVSLSREGLSLDPATVNAIAEAMVAVKANIVESFSTMFDNLPNKWAAMKLLAKETAGYSARGRLLAQHARYKGEELPQFIRPNLDVWAANSRGRRSTMSRWDFVHNGAVYPGATKALVIDDLPVVPQSRTLARIRHRFDSQLEYHQYIFVIRGDSVEKVLEELGNPSRSEYVLTSELPLPPAQPRAARATRGPDPRLFRCSYWDVCQNNLREIGELGERTVMVVMNNYNVPEGFAHKWRSNLVKFDETVFVNLRDSKHESLQHLRPFDEVFAEREAKFLAEKGDELAHLQAVRTNPILRDLVYRLNYVDFDKLGELTPAQKKRPFGKVLELKRTYFDVETPAGINLVQPKLPPRLNPERLKKQFDETHAKALVFMTEYRVMARDHAHELLKELV